MTDISRSGRPGPDGNPAAATSGALVPPKNLLSLQIIRAWAALVVVFVHVGVQLEDRYHGWQLPRFTLAGLIGVDVFFCLSGFIMYYTSRGDFGVSGAWRSFLLRRGLRIYPIYWVVTAATLLVALWPGSHLNLWARYSTGFLVKSLLLLPQETQPVISQGWTLVHEVRFYAIFGLLLLLPRRAAMPALAAWGGVSLTVLLISYGNQALLDSGKAAKAITYLCHPASLEFVLGVVAAIVVCHWRTPLWLDRLVLPAGIVATIVAMVWFQELSPNTKYFQVTVCLLPSFLLVLGAALAERRWRPRLPRPAVALGDASYSTYLIHNLVAIPIVWNLLPPAAASWEVLTFWACGIVVVVHALAWGVHKTIEGPLHDAARRLTRRGARRADASMTVPISAIGAQSDPGVPVAVPSAE